MMSLLYPLLTVATASLFLLAFRLYSTPGVGAVLAEQAREAAPPPKPFFERVILPLTRRLVPGYRIVIPFVDRRKVRQYLAWAGDPYGLKVNDVVQLKAGSMLLSVPLALYFSFVLSLDLLTTVAIMLAAAVPCFFIPDMWLIQRAEARQEEITRQLPDFMDLLAISIAAGVGFDLAMNNIINRSHGPLAEEMERMLREMRLGNPRRLCYRRVIWRNDSHALRSFFSAMIQADELGTPIADILESQAQTLRHQRIQEARRRGAKASTKISLVMSAILLFSLVGVILATMALNLAYGRIDVLIGGS
jgi:tight adherence protein C